MKYTEQRPMLTGCAKATALLCVDFGNNAPLSIC